jgi:hypothetical protein
MSTHPVSKIMGIGSVTSDALNSAGIKNVGDLSRAHPGQCSVNNLSTFINRAKLYISERENVVSPEKTSVSSGIPTVVKTVTSPKPEDTLQTETKNEDDSESNLNEKILIEDHTWWETKILIPNYDDDSRDLKEAIIYELSLEPFNRVSFICSWLHDTETDGEDDKGEKPGETLCTMTYSPQMILHFNMDLPILKITVDTTDWESMENRFTIENVVWETNTMSKFHNL